MITFINTNYDYFHLHLPTFNFLLNMANPKSLFIFYKKIEMNILYVFQISKTYQSILFISIFKLSKYIKILNLLCN
jgi:hypothetical protein